MDLKFFNETKVGHKVRMSSIIINSFYRALTSIEENEGIKNLTVKKLTTLLVDILYPEDGVLTWEDEKVLKIKFNGKVPVEEETHSVEITIPVAEPVPEPAAPEPEVKEIKVKETKPKLTKEEKEAEKAEKAAAAKAEKEAKAAAAKAEKEAKAAEAKAAKAAEPKAKAAKAKFVGNLEKLNATQEKLWKKVAADSKVELTDDHKKQFLAHINELDNTEYNTKKLETWMTEFFVPKEEPKTEEKGMFPVEYKGKEYLVDDNGDVYEETPGKDVVEKKVGKVGMAYFADMEMPTE
jgi:type IV secretory pathway VirB10-like protein